jgi:hypothetical protein
MEHINGLIKLTNAPDALSTKIKDGQMDPETLVWLDSIASQFASASNFVEDTGDPTRLTPGEATIQIQEIMSNPDYFSPGAIGNSLRAKMFELQKAANPSASRDARDLNAKGLDFDM